MDADIISIRETKKDLYSLQVAIENGDTSGRFDINGSENSSKFKIKVYITEEQQVHT